MAIANGTCVSFCNQPNAQFGYLRRVTPVCRCLHPFCGWRHLATSRHILASPRYVPGTITVNITRMEQGFNACQTHISIFLKDRLSTAHSTSLTMQCCDKQSIIVSNGSTRAVHGSQCKLFKHYLKLIVR